MSVTFSQVVNVILALAIVYYVLGLIVSVISKMVLDAFETKGKNLEEFLKRNLLGFAEKNKEGLLEQLKKLPQLSSLRAVLYAKAGLGFFTGETELSKHIERIPAKNLVDALFDLTGTMQKGEAKVIDVIHLLPSHIHGPDGSPIEIKTRVWLQNYVEKGFDDVEAVRAKLETWVEGLMEQASQEYKAKARRWVVAISFVITVLLGVDSIQLAQQYWHDAAISVTANTQAAIIIQSVDEENVKNAKLQDLTKQLDTMQALRFGWWNDFPAEAAWPWLPLKILGLLITTLAVSQGSSFWYDIIRQIKGEQTSTPKKDDALERGKPAAESMVVKTTRIEVSK
jgi:hypothetical protein